MILTRPGNKRKIVGELHHNFPPHRARIEPFFGGGGSWFKMPKPEFSFLGDGDDDVTNLWMVLMGRKDELIKAIESMPVAEALLKYWLVTKETEPVQKALRFLMLSNFTYMGKVDTMLFNGGHTKRHLLRMIEPTFKELTQSSVRLIAGDFREILGKISFSKKLLPKKVCFLYLDPSYLGRMNTYNAGGWSEQCSFDCLDMVAYSGMNAAMSEFENPVIIAAAERRGLKVTPIVRRRNMKSRDTEIIITNYDIPNRLF